MKDQMGREFTEEELHYDRIATKEEVEGMSQEEMKDLSKRARISPVIINECTFEPMVVIENVAYTIEPYKDDLN